MNKNREEVLRLEKKLDESSGDEPGTSGDDEHKSVDKQDDDTGELNP
jgi:hypothetical protein